MLIIMRGTHFPLHIDLHFVKIVNAPISLHEYVSISMEVTSRAANKNIEKFCKTSLLC